MARHKNLSDIQFSVEPLSGRPRVDHQVTAYDPSRGGDIENQQVGALIWSPEWNEIKDIQVSEDYRRRGIASKMFELAKIAHQTRPDVYSNPQHSDLRTDEGDSWAKSVGGYLPERTKDED